MFGKIQTFRSLRADLRHMAVEFVFLPLAVQTGFALLGAARTTEILNRWAGRRRSGDSQDDCDHPAMIRQALAIQRSVKKSLGIGGRCLGRSLVLQAILRRRGVATDLRIGIRKSSSQIEGHAWLEYENAPVNETAEQTATFVPFEGAAALDSWRG